MNAVLISIKPKWCDRIMEGKKTVEIRKTRPRRETPFKCYIYCTKPKYEYEDFLSCALGTDHAKVFFGGGKVIGEFVCDGIESVEIPYPAYWGEIDASTTALLASACLSLQEAHNYLGAHTGYGWHISDLKIYDQPKELKEFRRHDPTYDFSVFGEWSRTYSIQRAPQSWCYVEEIV